jgi:hypothetical protein
MTLPKSNAPATIGAELMVVFLECFGKNCVVDLGWSDSEQKVERVIICADQHLHIGCALLDFGCFQTSDTQY